MGHRKKPEFLRNDIDYLFVGMFTGPFDEDLEKRPILLITLPGVLIRGRAITVQEFGVRIPKQIFSVFKGDYPSYDEEHDPDLSNEQDPNLLDHVHVFAHEAIVGSFRVTETPLRIDSRAVLGWSVDYAGMFDQIVGNT